MSSDYRLEIFKRGECVEALYLKDVEGCRNVANHYPGCDRFDIWEDDILFIERWKKENGGEWRHVRIT